MRRHSDWGPRGLYRCNGIFLGVCGGLGERFGLSAWGIRILFLILQFTVIPIMFLIYLGLALIMRRCPRNWSRFDRYWDQA